MAAQETADMPVEPFSVGMYDAIESLFLPSAAVKLYDIIISHPYSDTIAVRWIKQK